MALRSRYVDLIVLVGWLLGAMAGMWGGKEGKTQTKRDDRVLSADTSNKRTS